MPAEFLGVYIAFIPTVWESVGRLSSNHWQKKKKSASHIKYKTKHTHMFVYNLSIAGCVSDLIFLSY